MYAFLILAGALFLGFVAGGTAQIAAATFPTTAISIPDEILQTIDAVHEAERTEDITTDLVPQPKVSQRTVGKTADSGSWGLDIGRSMFVSVGTVIGIVAFNFITNSPIIGSSVVAEGIAPAAVGTQIAVAESSAITAISIYGILSAFAGAVIGNNLYNQLQADAPLEEVHLLH
ncbi:hypothetical protein TI03_00055 [Achromatium sp. WMS1]|nr:hypothetical protein TI03_00055 [Achromatium sp. WMS1]